MFELWYAFFIGVAVIFAAILIREQDPRYVYFAIAGSVFGFILDGLNVFFGYYSFSIPAQILGNPMTVTIAEGFSVVITIWLFEKLVYSRWLKR